MTQADTNIASPAAANKGRKGKPVAKVQAKPQAPAPRPQQGRQVVTFETAARLCPNAGVASKIVTFYGLDEVDYHAIREATEEHLAKSAEVLADNLNEKALEIHLQRIVDAYVRSAYGAGTFYDGKAEAARKLTSPIDNEDRDEDRPGIDNTANKAERARIFAAQVGLQAYALLAAAHGAVDAYAHACGQDWKPYEGTQAPAQHVTRQAAAAQASAFDRD